jgi:hypothetical protein
VRATYVLGALQVSVVQGLLVEDLPALGSVLLLVLLGLQLGILGRVKPGV